jgi:hypothetical protein
MTQHLFCLLKISLDIFGNLALTVLAQLSFQSVSEFWLVNMNKPCMCVHQSILDKRLCMYSIYIYTPKGLVHRVLALTTFLHFAQ